MKSHQFTKEFILSIPKIVNANGCWIPTELKPESNGYVRVKIYNVRYLLHRIVLCLYYNIDYYDDKIETRHSKDCSRACFNHEHLKPGSQIDNKKDKVEHHADELCPICGSKYSYRKTFKDWIPRIERRCKQCHYDNQVKRRQLARAKNS
jgi:hypothetical protein